MRRGKSALPLPRFITPASIELGDDIRVTWTIGAIEHSRVATVVKREYDGHMRVFYAADGEEIFRWHPAHSTMKITLLKESESKSHSMLDFSQLVEVE